MTETPHKRSTENEAIDEPLVTLPDSLRSTLKDPLGPIETDAHVLLEDVTGPLVTVGDVVTYELVVAGEKPDVAIVDGKTKRSPIDADVESTLIDDPAYVVTNPPATITESLVRALMDALSQPEPVTILVEGEEDLATIPAIVATPEETSVVYGQPNEGMVHVRVDESVRQSAVYLLKRFDGDVDRLWELLSVSPEDFV